ncbi:MAG: hypothetical protein ABEH43_03310, partial [Flavobacteriales bacterium]
YYSNDHLLNINKKEKYPVECWDITSYDNNILVAENDVISYTNDIKGKNIILKTFPWTLKKSITNSSEFFVGLDNGFMKIKINDNGNVKDTTLFDEVKSSVFNISYEPKEKRYWLGTLNNGVYKYNIGNSDIVNYDTLDGLPEGPVYIGSIDEKYYFGTEKGLYRYNNNKKEENFVKADKLEKQLFPKNDNRLIHRILPQENGTTWLVTYLNDKEKFDIGRVVTDEKKDEIRWENAAFQPIKGVIHDIYTTENNVTWLGGLN